SSVSSFETTDAKLISEMRMNECIENVLNDGRKKTNSVEEEKEMEEFTCESGDESEVEDDAETEYGSDHEESIDEEEYRTDVTARYSDEEELEEGEIVDTQAAASSDTAVEECETMPPSSSDGLISVLESLQLHLPEEQRTRPTFSSMNPKFVRKLGPAPGGHFGAAPSAFAIYNAAASAELTRLAEIKNKKEEEYATDVTASDCEEEEEFGRQLGAAPAQNPSAGVAATEEYMAEMTCEEGEFEDGDERENEEDDETMEKNVEKKREGCRRDFLVSLRESAWQKLLQTGLRQAAERQQDAEVAQRGAGAEQLSSHTHCEKEEEAMEIGERVEEEKEEEE
ncbi:hypothetical protein PFISCL1PPCAC_9569, partial [Pristionchus fissidentatus]